MMFDVTFTNGYKKHEYYYILKISIEGYFGFLVLYATYDISVGQIVL